jgi:hypothetical protein
MRAGVRMEELISDVSEDGGASRRDAALGDQSEQAGEELAEVDSGRELGELREEVGGEVFRIVVQLEGSGGFGEAEMVRTKAEMRLRAREAATLPIGVAIEAASGIVEGDASRFLENRDAGIFRGWIHDAPSFAFFLGGTPGNLYGYQKKRLTKFAFRKCMILKEMPLAEQNGKRRENGVKKRKAGPRSRTPNAIIYENKCITN